MLSKSQQLLVDSTSNLTLLVGGYGSGKTYAIVQKAALTKYSVAIISIDLNSICYIHEELMRINSNYSNISLLDFSMLDELTHKDLIIIDNFDVLDYDQAEKIYNDVIRFASHIIVTCSPNSDYPLDKNFCYQLSQKRICDTIHMNISENEYLPEDFVERLKELFDPLEYKYILEGTFVYKEDK